jgi:hypothetical protein
MVDHSIRRRETGFGGTPEHCPPKPFFFHISAIGRNHRTGINRTGYDFIGNVPVRALRV